MDLRVIKTKKSIKNAFFNLRIKYPVEKIKVSEICKIAMINKSTFYRYYYDVFDLSAKLQEDVVNRITINFTQLRDIVSETDKFIESLLVMTNDNREAMVLFAGREEEFIALVQKRIEKLILPKQLETRTLILVNFIVGGLSFAIRDLQHGKYSKEEFKNIIKPVIAELTQLLDKE